MKLKHENTIRNIGMFALVLAMILMKVGNIYVQATLGVASFIGCLLGGIYFAYKGSKIGGGLMFCIALTVLLVILGKYFNSYNPVILIPALFIVAMILSYKAVVISRDKEKIRTMKKTCTITIILCIIIEIVMIIPLFYKQ